MPAPLSNSFLSCLWLPESLWNTDVSWLLIFIGIVLIYFEFLSPGLVLPGAVGSVLTLLAASVLSGFAIDWRGAALIALAFVLFAIEATYLARGLAAASGAVALLVGSILLIADSAHRIHFATAAAVAIPFALITSFLFAAAVRARHNKAPDILKENLK